MAVYPSLRFIIADDVALNLEIAAESVRQHFENVEIEEAMNGKEVLELLERQDFDLILMDVHMPEMSGMEAASYIRKKFPQAKQNIPIIAFTGSTRPLEIAEALASGMDRCINKPIQPYELAQVVAELLHLQLMTNHAENTARESVGAVGSNGFDPSVLRNFCDGDEAQMRYFIRKFVAQCPGEYAKMDTALKSNDRKALRLTAHSFWPQLEFIGLKKAASIADAIERESQQGFRENVLSGLLSTLKNDIEMGLETLKKDWL